MQRAASHPLNAEETNSAETRPSYEMSPLSAPQPDDIISFEALYISMRKCIRGVLWKDSVAKFYLNWMKEVLKLSDELKTGKYRERPPKIFQIYYPKQREIMSVAFRDRVYQRSLNDVAIYPAVSRSLIYDNYACQKGKGPDLARDRIKLMLKRCSGDSSYILKIDIKGYYPNMPHWVAKETLRRYLSPEIYTMAEKVIDSHPGEVGFCPGSQIIQIVGISALDPVDHFIKERLRVRNYGRYMDDLVLMHESREYLEYCLAEIEKRINAMGMELNRKKTKITHISRGLDFLGYHFFKSNTGKVVATVLPKKLKMEKQLITKLVRKVKTGERTIQQLDEHVDSWLATIAYGNTDKTRRDVIKFYHDKLREELGDDYVTESVLRSSRRAKKGKRGRRSRTA